ncbi:endonuclease/exonuclease/phosphatase family protein [uncultured Williamsia sp.]|uniref:endonuclease/exonuclease/phosphatase family protein n=1 Tax=uncultured Williamsia sp. TaxID=259311 RepID=UPI0026342755|nr:endonuclease/exonuclease/phosphatase family protein [uncultured Williamsia sp.]
MTGPRRTTAVDGAVVVGLGVAGAATVLRRYRGRAQLPVAAASFASWLALTAPVATVVSAARRRRAATVVGAVLTAVVVHDRRALIPSWRRRRPEPGALRVMQANLWLGRADADAVVAAVAAHDVDLLCVQELTPECRDALGDAGLDHHLPYRFVVAAPQGAGTGLWSRHPLHDAHALSGFTCAAVQARVQFSDATAVTLLSVHPMPPYPYEPRLWLAELRRIRDAVDSCAGPVIVGGDLNAAHDHAAFRALVGDGLVDAGAASRSGPLPTYPAHKRWIPPLIGIDHVLLRGVRAIGVVRVRVPGSDHRAVVATVRFE